MRTNGTSTGNEIVSIAGKVSSQAAHRMTVEVETTTGDLFCRSFEIKKINFLKVDTEGHDLKVVVGFREMLLRKEIDFVQVEASMCRSNTKHVGFDRFQEEMSKVDYGLLGLFEQAIDTRTGRLRRANLLFAPPQKLARSKLSGS